VKQGGHSPRWAAEPEMMMMIIIIIIIIIIMETMKLRNYKKTAILGTAHILRKVLM
jgi:hypothetical protein